MAETAAEKVAGKPKLKRKSLTVAQKKRLISEYESGQRIIQLSNKYNMATSTLTTIIKNRAQIKAARVSVGIKKLYEKGCRNTLHDRMEKDLLVWIHNEQMDGQPLTQNRIREQAKKIFEDLVALSPDKAGEQFKGSNGWFHQFKKRAGIWCKGEGLRQVHLKQEEEEEEEYDKPVLLHVVEGNPEEVVYNMEPSEITGQEDSKEEEQEQEPEDYAVEGEQTMEEMEGEDDDQADFDYTDMKIPTEDILRMMHYWEEFHILANKWHPNKRLIEEIDNFTEDKCLRHFRDLLKKREFAQALGKVLNST